MHGSGGSTLEDLSVAPGLRPDQGRRARPPRGMGLAARRPARPPTQQSPSVPRHGAWASTSASACHLGACVCTASAFALALGKTARERDTTLLLRCSYDVHDVRLRLYRTKRNFLPPLLKQRKLPFLPLPPLSSPDLPPPDLPSPPLLPDRSRLPLFLSAGRLNFSLWLTRVSGSRPPLMDRRAPRRVRSFRVPRRAAYGGCHA